MPYSIAQLNQMTQDEFVAVLGAIFEETPVIARQAWEKRPFLDVADLHQQMVEVVRVMRTEEQLVLIQAHLNLGSKTGVAE